MVHDSFGLGCWAYGLADEGSEAERVATDVIRAAYDRGVRHFDTAQGYGDGRSERIVGAALSGLEDAGIATKVGLLSGDETPAAVQTSRERLGVSSIDLFYIHWPKNDVDPRPMLDALERERAQGTIKRIGVSNFPVAELERGSEVARIDVHQIGYSLLWRYPEQDVIPWCREHDVEIYSYSSLAQGLLTGKMPRRPSFEPGDPRPATVFYDDEVWPHVYGAVNEMNEVASQAGIRLHHLALHWLLRSGVSRVLVGARNVDQLEDNLSTFSEGPSDETLAALGRISDGAHEHIPDIGNIFKYYP